MVYSEDFREAAVAYKESGHTSHYRFKQYLKYKANEYGKHVINVNEAYTSKTASWTGEVIEKLGSKKFIRSQNRDINGARGIMLRTLRASSIDVV